MADLNVPPRRPRDDRGWDGYQHPHPDGYRDPHAAPHPALTPPRARSGSGRTASPPPRRPRRLPQPAGYPQPAATPNPPAGTARRPAVDCPTWTTTATRPRSGAGAGAGHPRRCRGGRRWRRPGHVPAGARPVQ
ncbi:hypothetical protein V2I01_03430 [Micromonospora sp. BRA006-A]|nr:hypothetical protein [Micromonospora sp. BRA006-A]